MFEKLKDIITHVDWKQLHFLRPDAFYLFIPLGVIALLLIVGNKEKKKWKKLIAPALRPFMFTKSSGLSILLPILLFIIGMSCVIVGLAGPTWKKKDIPGQKIQAVVLIAIDLSKSMTAKDIEPSRLERAKFKLSDFLDADPRARAGLIAFAGTAHPVLPFTSDYKLIKHQAQSLDNRVMPVQGSNIQILITAVDSIMRQILAPSTILLMTDVIDEDDAVILTNYITGTPHKLEILLFSTPNGSPVPGHTNIISKQDISVISNLSQNNKVHITPITLDKSDVEGIAKNISDKLIFETDKKKDEKDWDDMGWLLILPAMLVALFWFRKGWVIQWCWLPFVLLTMNSCGLKSKNLDWWYTKDYQGQLYDNAKQYSDAADHFEDNTHKAIAYYKAGDYEAAESLFEMDSSASGQYNRGLALAKLGRYDEAVTIFEKASEMDPALAEKVKKSITHAKQQKKLAEDVAQYDGKPKDKELAKKDKKKKEKKGDKDQDESTGDDKLKDETQVKKMPQDGRKSEEGLSDIHRGKEQKFPPKNFKMDPQVSTSTKILLQQTNADPSEFLHRRFEIQKERYYKNVKPSKNSW
ncbi:vWA domain-containing protein [Chitinophagaceae bacterium LWZ2-11]